MRREIMICDQCRKAEVRPGGYLANMVTIKDTIVTLSVTRYGSVCDPAAFELAFCGKECLMKRVNEETDTLKVMAEDVPASSARVQRSATTQQPPRPVSGTVGATPPYQGGELEAA